MNVHVKTHPFQRRATLLTVPAGESLAVLSGLVRGPIPVHAISVNGDLVPPDQWASRVVAETDFVVLYGVPQKDTLGTLAFIAAAINPLFLGTFGVNYALTRDFDASVQRATIGFGPLAPIANLIILGSNKPKAPSLGATDPLTNFITGIGNQPDPFGVVPKVYGKIRLFPKFPGKYPTQYTEIRGDDQYLRALFLVAKGPVAITDIRLGETAIDSLQDVTYEVREGYPTDAPVTLYTRDVEEQALNIQLTLAGSWQTRTTALNCERISVDWTLPRGLQHFTTDGQRGIELATVELQYKLVTEPTVWTSRPIPVWSGQTGSAIRKNESWDVPAGQYDVRTRVLDADSDDRNIHDVSWTNLRTIRNEIPVLEPEAALIAVYIRATDQLNGVIENLNCLVEGLAQVTDGALWYPPVPSRNPAWAVADILTGNANRRPLSLDRLDAPSFLAFANYCATAGFEFNHVFDSDGTLFGAANLAAVVGRGSLDTVDGKYMIVMDAQQPVITQAFTPRNTWGVEGRAAYPNVIHGLRVGFRNVDLDYQTDERVVYDDPYDESTATKLDFLQYPGVVTHLEVWKLARHELACRKLRFEEWDFYADFEHLLCTRGDLVMWSHDAILIGLGWGRIRRLEFAGTAATAMELDTTVVMDPTKTYGIQIRRTADRAILLTPVINTGLTTNRLTFASLAGLQPAVGDLVTFGEWGEESQRVIIKAIQPTNENGSLAARLTVVPEAPGVYSAASEAIPPHTPIISIPALPANLRPPTPTIRVVRSDESVSLVQDSGDFSALMVVAVSFPSGFNPSLVYIQAQFRPLDGGGNWIHTTVEEGTNGEVVIPAVEVLRTYEVRVRSLNKLNLSLISPWSATVNHQVLGDTIAPGPPTSVNVYPTDRGARLTWFLPVDPFGATEVDFAAVEIWRSLTNDSDDALFVGETAGETWLDSGMANGTTYYYWVRARDWAGNLSAFHVGQTSGLSVVPTANVVLSKAEARLASKTLNVLENILTLNYTANGAKIHVEGRLFIDNEVNDPDSVASIVIGFGNAVTTFESYTIEVKRIGPGYPGVVVFSWDEQPAAGSYTYKLIYGGSSVDVNATNIAIFVQELES